MIEKQPVAALGPSLGPFARGVQAGRLVAFSGTSAYSHLSGPMESRELPSTFGAQARQTFANLGAALEAAGLDWSDAIKMTVVLKRRDDYAELNAIRSELFTEEPIASTTFIAELLREDKLIEVDLWALARDGDAASQGASVG